MILTLIYISNKITQTRSCVSYVLLYMPHNVFALTPLPISFVLDLLKLTLMTKCQGWSYLLDFGWILRMEVESVTRQNRCWLPPGQNCLKLKIQQQINGLVAFISKYTRNVNNNGNWTHHHIWSNAYLAAQQWQTL